MQYLQKTQNHRYHSSCPPKEHEILIIFFSTKGMDPQLVEDWADDGNNKTNPMQQSYLLSTTVPFTTKKLSLEHTLHNEQSWNLRIFLSYYMSVQKPSTLKHKTGSRTEGLYSLG
jgi:hypothetical protein